MQLIMQFAEKIDIDQHYNTKWQMLKSPYQMYSSAESCIMAEAALQGHTSDSSLQTTVLSCICAYIISYELLGQMSWRQVTAQGRSEAVMNFSSRQTCNRRLAAQGDQVTSWQLLRAKVIQTKDSSKILFDSSPKAQILMYGVHAIFM